MPSVSKAQNRAMHAAAAGKSNIGIPQSVGQDFVSAGLVKNAPERIKHPQGNSAPMKIGKKGKDIGGMYSMTDPYQKY